MALEYFLEVSGLGGSSTTVGREAAFKVTVEDLQASNTASSGGGGAGAGKAAISALTVGVADETGLTDFLRLFSTGGHVSAASLIAQVSGAGGGVEAYRLNLADVVVTGVHETEAGGYQVELAFAQMGVLTRDQNPDGSFDPAEGFGFNLLTNSFVPPPADAHPAAPAGAIAASQYFLLIDGVNGGSSQAGHAGWFELPHFDFDMDAAISLGSGVGVTHFGPITLDLPNLGGLTSLIGDSLTGATRAGLRIEGTDSQGHVHYSLDLADLFIKSVQESDGAGYRVTLDYGRIKLTTTPQDAAGGPGAPQTFSWDIDAHHADVGVLPTLAPAASSLTPPSGAGDYILEVAGLRGPSVLAGAEGGFQVTRFAFDVGNSGGLPGAGGAGVGKATTSGLTLHFADETGVADFLKLAANGQHLSAASLTAHAGAGEAEVYRVNLANVIVTSVEEDEGHGFDVHLDFGQIGVEVQGQAADGSLSPLGSIGYDLVAAKIEAPPADATPGPAIGPTGAAHYFLLVDGVNGGATQAGHAGWFDLGDFDFSVTDLASIASGGAGAGKAIFSDLSVEVANLGGFTQLLAKLATGGAIPGVRVEGVDGAGHVTYRLDLADVTVSGVHEDEGTSGYRAAFAYGRVALTPFSQQPDGSFDPGPVFTWNLAANSPGIGSLPVIAPAPGALSPPGEGNAFFLEVSGLSGDAATAGVQGAFQVVDFGFDATATTSAGGSGSGVGTSHFGPVHVTLADEAGLADFLKLVANGQHVAAASITGLRLGAAGNPEVYRLNLADVTVTDVHETQGHGYEVTLAYRTIGVLAHPQNPDGSLAPAQTFGFDTVAHATVAPPADAVPGPAVGSAGANSYVMLIDGVAGDSAVVRHAGWFDLASFDVDIQGLIATGGGGGAGKSDFGPLSVHLPGFTGLDDLFKDLLSGKTIAGLRIEGLTAGKLTYQLDLADVVVSQVRDDEAGGYDVQFDYGRVSLVSYAQRPDGTVQPTTAFTWNIAANSPDIGALPPISPSGGNLAPVAVNDGPIAVNEDATTTNLYGQLLGNDSDPNPGDNLAISAVDTTGTKGTVVFDAATHTLTYAADADVFDLLATGASVTDTFGYTVRDAAGLTSTATVTVRVTGTADGVVIVGQNKAGVLTGTTGDDSIQGGNGADQINGAAGADTISGGNGDDGVHGAAGIDLLSGDNGDDQLFGEQGDDTQHGDNGADRLFGGAGNDQLFGDLGADTLEGDQGSDRLAGGSGDDRFVFLGDPSTPAEVDRILDFEHGDKVVFRGGLSIAATIVRDFDGDGHLDTVHTLSNSQTLVLLGYTGWSAGDFIVG